MATFPPLTYTDDEKSKIIDHVLAELSAGIPVSKILSTLR